LLIDNARRGSKGTSALLRSEAFSYSIESYELLETAREALLIRRCEERYLVDFLEIHPDRVV